MLFFKITFTDVCYRKHVFKKKTGNLEEYIKTYCCGNLTKIANN